MKCERAPLLIILNGNWKRVAVSGGKVSPSNPISWTDGLVRAGKYARSDILSQMGGYEPSNTAR